MKHNLNNAAIRRAHDALLRDRKRLEWMLARCLGVTCRWASCIERTEPVSCRRDIDRLMKEEGK